MADHCQLGSNKNIQTAWDQPIWIGLGNNRGFHVHSLNRESSGMALASDPGTLRELAQCLIAYWQRLFGP